MRPDVMLIDIRMPKMDGVTATAKLTEDAAAAGVRVLILTTVDADQYVHDALRAGASGFLLEDGRAGRRARGRDQGARRSEALLSPRITRRLIDHYAQQAQPDPGTVDQINRLTLARPSSSCAIEKPLTTSGTDDACASSSTTTTE